MMNKDEYYIKVYGVAQPTFSKFLPRHKWRHSRLSGVDSFQCVPKENERHISVLSDFFTVRKFETHLFCRWVSVFMGRKSFWQFIDLLLNAKNRNETITCKQARGRTVRLTL